LPHHHHLHSFPTRRSSDLSSTDREDYHQARADHDPRGHSEQIDHRRDEDEAAADTEKDGEHPGEEAEGEGRDGRKIESRAVETRSEEHTSELQSLAYLVCR